MGDGKNLKKYLDEKGTNVRKIAKATGISATTLYSIIQKDSNIRFDFALRLANELQIDVNEICSASPFSDTIKEKSLDFSGVFVLEYLLQSMQQAEVLESADRHV